MVEAVVFNNVVKEYGSFRALDGLDLTIGEGELYGLIGPNGAGKTTTIRILTGLQRMTSGEVRVLGFGPQEGQVRPLIGYMPQETALYVELTVRENLALFGRLFGLGRKELKGRIDDLLAFVDLTRWADTVVNNLSGGMKHRASLAAALLPKPKLVVLDEPTVGVDPELRATFWARFGEMRKDGTTILLTTHYMDEAMRCERVGLVNHGKLIAEGSPTALLERAQVASLEEAFLKLAGRHREDGQ